MKHWLILFLLAMTLIGISCQNTDDMSPREVFEHSIAEMERVNNFAMHTNMTIEQESQPSLEANIDADIALDPLKMYQVQSVSVESEGESLQNEMYLTEEGMFMYDPQMEQWFTFPQEMFEQMMGRQQTLTDPAQEMQNFQPYLDDFTFTEKQDYYNFYLSSAQSQFEAFVLDRIPADLIMTEDMMPEMIEDIDIQFLEYEIKVDKETYQQVERSMVAEYEINLNGQTLPMKQHIHSTYNAFDDLDEIVIPDEVIQNAENMFGDELVDEEEEFNTEEGQEE